jgi:hypothetical protein
MGLATVFGGGGVVAGSGAFRTVEAQRTVDVSTSSDAGANLGMKPLNTPNGKEYAEIDGDTLCINIPNVNLNAITHIHNVFKVVNNSGQSVVVYFEEKGGTKTAAVDFGAKLDQGFDKSNVGGGDQPTSDGIVHDNIIDISNPTPSGYENIGVLLESGESFNVGVYIDTSDANLNDGLNESSSANIGNETILNDVIVHASSSAADQNDYYVEKIN